MTCTLFYDYEIAESLGFVVPLYLIFEDIIIKSHRLVKKCIVC